MITLTRTLYTALQQRARGEHIPADLRMRLADRGLLDTAGYPTRKGQRALDGDVFISGIEVG